MMLKLLELEKKEKQVQNQIKQRKNFLHTTFLQSHKKEFWLLDILFVLGILFNLGAVSMTNMILVEQASAEGYDTMIVEMNPIVAEEHNLPMATKENMSGFWKMIGFVIFAWFAWIFCYLYFRSRAFTKDSLRLLMIGTVFFAFMMGMNFFNDLGFFL